MPTGPGSSGQVSGGQALAGSSQVPGRRSRTPSMSTRRTGRCSCAPKTMAATWPMSHTSPQAANSSAATTSQKVSGTLLCSGLRSRSRHIRATSFRGSDGLRFPQAGAAAAMTVGGVVGVVGAELMAALAVGLAGLGMAGRRAVGLRAAGAVGRDEVTDDLLGLAAPDAVLLAGPHRERQAGIAHRAGRADADGLALAGLSVSEERVVIGRDQIAAGSLITPATHLGHAAVPSAFRRACVARLAWRALMAAKERRAK